MKHYAVSSTAIPVTCFRQKEVALNMNCFKFNQLAPQSQLQYIYDDCRLLDFIIEIEGSKQDARCLYYDGQLFIEVHFDGLQGDRVKEICSYPTVNQLSHWYEQVNLSAIFQNVPKD
ncbi:hypothetical protein [Tunicatimonas pelagia]|uniref:hypothetical protein n=1 Tax=Tunicatimonas pelagia TaxID=931531 RepID=UPI0026653061|nr:hypothetical protein [Tunicatimonas pelagia]WKN41250.1 hypothetical protein P0M28_19625 [Tunicatimonas pelagia]